MFLAVQKRDFTLVFRTFGTDIVEVVDEINMFATGQHPAYPQVGRSPPIKRMQSNENMSVDKFSKLLFASLEGLLALV